MIEFLTSLLGIATLSFYVYVSVAVGRMEWKAGADWDVILLKATTWPVTIWHTIKKLYDA